MLNPAHNSERQTSPGKQTPQTWAIWIYAALLSLAFMVPLHALVSRALDSSLHSYVLLVPFIAAYLVNLRRGQLPAAYASSPVPALVFLGIGALALAVGVGAMSLDQSDRLALSILAYLCALVAGGFFFLGREWMSAVTFPAAFLVFMTPLPDRLVEWLENGSKIASAAVASCFFDLSGTPNLKDNLVFYLPDISIRVAPECSGIRSSLMLLITSLLAAYLFLRTPWRQAILVALVIPLGFVRNGFRIWVIGQLCVYVGPHMIDNPIHHHGGPVFFALSLVPLFLLIYWLHRAENPPPSSLA